VAGAEGRGDSAPHRYAGLVIKWNPLTVAAMRSQTHCGRASGFGIVCDREMYVKDIEELSGTYDVIKGSKPAGVEAAAALQLLVERHRQILLRVSGSW